MATSLPSIQNSGEEMTSVKFDMIVHLPIEIVENIFTYLTAEDLHSATSCCLSWRTKVTTDEFWKRLCNRDHYFEVEERNQTEFYTDFLKKHNYWQGVYLYNYTLQRNWETNSYKEEIYEVEQNFRIRTFVGVDIFAYYNRDSTELCVYNLKLKEFEPILFTMRKNPCFDPKFDGQVFIRSGKYLIHFIRHESLTVWNLDDGSTVYDESCRLFTFIHVDKNLILLERWLDKFQVYNIETGEIEYEHERIRNADIMDGRIVFTTKDDMIHILKWTDKSEVTLKTYCNYSSDCRLLVKDDFLLIFCACTRDAETLCVWNIKTMTKLHSINLENSCYIGASASFMNKYFYLERKNRDDVSVGPLVELWDYTKGTLVTTINRQYASSKLSNDQFMIACNSGEIGIWCFRTMDFICDVGLDLHSVKCFENAELSQTKIVILKVVSPHELCLYVRDYEI